MVPGSGSELTRLFTNLLENAVRHTPPEGTYQPAGQARCRTRIDVGPG
jgi:signal transduction histidine kinase